MCFNYNVKSIYLYRIVDKILSEIYYALTFRQADMFVLGSVFGVTDQFRLHKKNNRFKKALYSKSTFCVKLKKLYKMVPKKILEIF